MNGADIKTLKQMTIGEIRELKKAQKSIGDVIDMKRSFLGGLNDN